MASQLRHAVRKHEIVFFVVINLVKFMLRILDSRFRQLIKIRKIIQLLHTCRIYLQILNTLPSETIISIYGFIIAAYFMNVGI